MSLTFKLTLISEGAGNMGPRSPEWLGVKMSQRIHVPLELNKTLHWGQPLYHIQAITRCGYALLCLRRWSG